MKSWRDWSSEEQPVLQPVLFLVVCVSKLWSPTLSSTALLLVLMLLYSLKIQKGTIICVSLGRYRKKKEMFIFWNPERIFVFPNECVALYCKVNGSLMLCFPTVSCNCLAFEPRLCFVCSNCEENSGLKSVFVKHYVNILMCMLKTKPRTLCQIKKKNLV